MVRSGAQRKGNLLEQTGVTECGALVRFHQKVYDTVGEEAEKKKRSLLIPVLFACLVLLP
jgi:hypothetical protein